RALLRGRDDAGGDRAGAGPEPPHRPEAASRVPRLRPQGALRIDAGNRPATRRRAVIADLGGPGPACSALRVRRFAAGELSGVEQERMQAHVDGCSRCQAALREIETEKARLLRDVPFEQFAAGVAEKLSVAPAPR